MRCLVSLLLPWLLGALLGPAAQAGAWARAPGEVFLSFSSNLQADADTLASGLADASRYDSLYLEVGLGRRLTFGAEYGQGEFTREAMAFLRYTLTRPEAGWQVAVDLGAGRREVDQLGERDLLRAGLSLGHGFARDAPGWPGWSGRGRAEGWMALDAVAVQDTTLDTMRWKAEATLGLTLATGHALMLQLLAEEWPGNDVSYGINPSVVFRLGDRSNVELGMRATFAGQEAYGLELGIWHRF